MRLSRVHRGVAGLRCSAACSTPLPQLLDGEKRRVIRILTLSSLYPNVEQPDHGVFVEQRLQHLLATGEVSAEVIAPVPWFPFPGARFGRYGVFARVASQETRHGVRVSHPRVPVLPKVGMAVAPYLMAAALRGPVRATLERAPFDVIDAHYLYPDGVAAAMLARRIGKPFVLTARGSDVNVIARHAGPRRMIAWAIRHAGQVVTVSRALRTELVKLGIEESRVDVLPNGVDLELFSDDRRPAVREGPERVLLVVGHLKPGKGHALVLQALRSLTDCVVRFAGDGPIRRLLEEQASTLGVTARVQFLGSVPHTRLADHYRRADALILASEREGMPNVILEALACGTPVVATSVGGVAEIMTDPVAGVLLESSSVEALVAGVRTLLARPPSSRRVREFALRFGWDAATRGQLEIFRRLVAEQDGRRGAPAAATGNG
jgi:teichuronic acid biosynthesis glycosyltransferase TuaC